MTANSACGEPVEIESRKVAGYLLWAVLAGGWLMTAAALVSYDSADWPGRFVAPHNIQPVNWVGRAGALAADELYMMVGPGIWVLMAGGLAALITKASKREVSEPGLRSIGLVLMGLTGSALIDLTTRGSGQSPIGNGGLLANYANAELLRLFNPLGTLVILLVVFWIGAIVAMDQVIAAAGRIVLRCGSLVGSRMVLPKLRFAGIWTRLATLRAGNNRSPSKALKPVAGDDDLSPGTRRLSGDPSRSNDASIDPDAGGIGATESFGREGGPQSHAGINDDEEDAGASSKVIVSGESDAVNASDATGSGGQSSDSAGTYVKGQTRFSPDQLRAKIKALPINLAPVNRQLTPPPRQVDLSGYRFPEISLLVDSESKFSTNMERHVRDQAVQLESALHQYRIDGEVVGIDSGPVITLFEIRLAPGTKVAQVHNVASDIARALKAYNVRIVSNMAGKDTVGIEVPNIRKEAVRLKELMIAHADTVQRMKLPMWLGKDASGNPLIADLASMPHMLIAGTTGSGKSVCMNSVIMSFLFTKRPDELKLVLVDPKMVEMSLFKDVPHLMCPVVTEMPKAAAILEWATTKMDERYELLAEAGVRDVIQYNNLTPEELKDRFQPTNQAEEARIPNKLPFIVFMVDELADLMMTAKEVEGYIVRLAQKARAVGLHLILATQRPQANVVTGLIKSNMPCRVSFKVASGMDSRIVLDQKGAELLLGQGDMLYLSPRTSKITRAQGTLVDDSEIRRTVEFLKNVAEPNYEPQLVQLKSANLSGDDSERDPLFDDAVEIVLQSQRGSVSLLQRRLTIGYSRASRLIEQMAAAGIIGNYKGSQAREVVIGLDEWEALKAQAEADSAEQSGASQTSELETDPWQEGDIETTESDETDEFMGEEDDNEQAYLDDDGDDPNEGEEEEENKEEDDEEEDDEDGEEEGAEENAGEVEDDLVR